MILGKEMVCCKDLVSFKFQSFDSSRDYTSFEIENSLKTFSEKKFNLETKSELISFFRQCVSLTSRLIHYWGPVEQNPSRIKEFEDFNKYSLDATNQLKDTIKRSFLVQDYSFYRSQDNFDQEIAKERGLNLSELYRCLGDNTNQSFRSTCFNQFFRPILNDYALRLKKVACWDRNDNEKNKHVDVVCQNLDHFFAAFGFNILPHAPIYTSLKNEEEYLKYKEGDKDDYYNYFDDKSRTDDDDENRIEKSNRNFEQDQKIDSIHITNDDKENEPKSWEKQIEECVNDFEAINSQFLLDPSRYTELDELDKEKKQFGEKLKSVSCALITLYNENLCNQYPEEISLLREKIISTIFNSFLYFSKVKSKKGPGNIRGLQNNEDFNNRFGTFKEVLMSQEQSQENKAGEIKQLWNEIYESYYVYGLNLEDTDVYKDDVISWINQIFDALIFDKWPDEEKKNMGIVESDSDNLVFFLEDNKDIKIKIPKPIEDVSVHNNNNYHQNQKKLGKDGFIDKHDDAKNTKKAEIKNKATFFNWQKYKKTYLLSFLGLLSLSIYYAHHYGYLKIRVTDK